MYRCICKAETLKSWDDEGDALIPVSVVKPDVCVAKISELRHLLQSLRYWIVSKIPATIYDFALRTSRHCCEPVLRKFENDMLQVSQLLYVLAAPRGHRWTRALELGFHCSLCLSMVYLPACWIVVLSLLQLDHWRVFGICTSTDVQCPRELVAPLPEVVTSAA